MLHDRSLAAAVAVAGSRQQQWQGQSDNLLQHLQASTSAGVLVKQQHLLDWPFMQPEHMLVVHITPCTPCCSGCLMAPSARQVQRLL
jgi:hypothetical protein